MPEKIVTNGRSCVTVKLLMPTEKGSPFVMTTVTQKMRHCQILISYADKYGGTKAALRYNTNRQYITYIDGKRDMTERCNLLRIDHTDHIKNKIIFISLEFCQSRNRQKRNKNLSKLLPKQRFGQLRRSLLIRNKNLSAAVPCYFVIKKGRSSDR